MVRFIYPKKEVGTMEYFQSARKFVTNLDNLREQVTNAYLKIIAAIEKFQKEEPGWIFQGIIEHTVNISIYEPL